MKLKRLLALMLTSAILIASLTACSSEEETTEETTEGTTTEETTTELETLDYSSYFTDLGHFNDITALDYVVLPENYESATLPEDTLVITNEEVQAEIDTIIANGITYAEVDETYAFIKDDKVIIDFVGSIDGVEFEGGAGQDQELTVGSQEFIDDFLTQIIGHKIGDNFDVEVTFPEEYSNNPDLAGKDAVFNVTIKGGSQRIVPEFTDELVNTVFQGEYTTTDEVISAFSEAIIYQKQTAYIDEYLTTSEVSEVPAIMTEFVQKATLDSVNQAALQYGLDIATYVTLLGYADLDAYLADSQEIFQTNAKYSLIYQALQESLGLELTTDEVVEYIDSVYGEGYYDLAVTELGANYIAYSVSQGMAKENLHKMMIENTPNAVMPSFYE